MSSQYISDSLYPLLTGYYQMRDFARETPVNIGSVEALNTQLKAIPAITGNDSRVKSWIETTYSKALERNTVEKKTVTVRMRTMTRERTSSTSLN